MKPEKMDALLTLLGNVIEGLGREGLILQEKALAKLPIQRQWDINFYYKQFGRISPFTLTNNIQNVIDILLVKCHAPNKSHYYLHQNFNW